MRPIMFTGFKEADHFSLTFLFLIDFVLYVIY